MDHEGAQPNQPSSPGSQQHRRRREEQDSNQSNQRRRIDDTSVTDNENNNSSRSSRQDGYLARSILALQLFLQTLNRQPSSPTSQQHRPQREEPDSNQSNQSRRIYDTSATDDNVNNSSRSSSSRQDENLPGYRQLLLPTLFNMQMEDALPGNVNDGDETVEEDRLVSDDERLNSNIQDDQNQRGTSILVMIYRGSIITVVEESIGMVQRGLSKDIISSQLKTRVHTTSADSTEENTEICTICLDGYGNKNKIATLDCKHEYHEDCITQWLVRNNVCPICKRQGLTLEESKKEEELNE
ncbi:hypothetical protein MKX03_013378 [Papaver bracteatum]|nr:hypothetical protein MKX03_013378 [Papaver bracteatum]